MKFDKHTVILGSTGSGKTYFGAWSVNNLVTTPYTIFLNTANEISVEKACDVTVRGYDEVEDYITNHSKGSINYVVDSELEQALRQINEVKQMVFAIGNVICKTNIINWMTIFFDEVQIFAGKGSNYNDVDILYTRGRRQGVICVALSQRPALVSQTVLTQTVYQVYFKFGDYEQGYFQRYGIDLQKYEEWLKQPYHFLWVTPFKVQKVKPVKSVVL